MPWQFWIDVGGTFTDCLGRDEGGTLHRAKVLSSGVTKGRVEACDGRKIVDSLRRDDPPNFWCGFTLTLLDETGLVLGQSQVDSFDRESAAIMLTDDLQIQPGLSYELSADLDAPILAIRRILGLSLEKPLPPVSVRLGTTRGTNALLTRRGARTAFVTTRGFADILHIGYQNRPKLFALNIEKPTPLFATTVEIDERLAADGTVLTSLNEHHAREALTALKTQTIDSLAICLLHAYRNPVHEMALAKIARELGYADISLSHEVAPLIKLVARGDTTVVDAYLNPVLNQYVARLRKALHPDSDVKILTSAGGLVAAENFRGKDSILSGPAGGVIGFSRVAAAAGVPQVIGFDMGGTSTDVARYDGRYEMQYETEKAGVRVVSPMLAIETVAAGGGSLCWFDGVKLCVGPDSAGADPGPACYGRGGPLAVTDCNFFLGKILPGHFPFPLDRAAVETRLQNLADQIAAATGTHYALEDLAVGLVRIANANMCQAIRSVSTTKGYDVRDYALVAFGGAAAQHACAVAQELGINTILNHPDAGLLSAYGMGLADVTHHAVQALYRPLDSLYTNPKRKRGPSSDLSSPDLDTLFNNLATEGTQAVLAQGVPSHQIRHESPALELRYAGTDASLVIELPTDHDFAAAFAHEHRRRYGYVHENKAIEIVAARRATVGVSAVTVPSSQRVTARPLNPQSTHPIYFAGQWHAAGLYHRVDLKPGDLVTGPALIAEQTSTTILDPAWQAEVLTGGELLLTRHQSSDYPPATSHSATIPSPIDLEIFNHHFAGIAERMGLTLRNTSSSVNVKERLDFSCALFTAAGDLVVNAPHIPVHLGAMSETVKQLVARHPAMQPGDVYVTNDPYRGGSHLPDITIVTPVHDPTTGGLQFFTASRAHHAEIGGITPGSMPPFSKSLAEEGVLIRDFLLVNAGRSCFDELAALLTTGPYPSRAVTDNLADIAAQVAANHQGASDLLAFVERHTWPVVSAYMQHIQAAAEQKTRAALAKLPPGKHTFIDHLDDGTPIAVSITIAGDRATIDFSGTGPVSIGNLNANRAIVTAAVMYVLRLLIDEDIPLNQGVLAPVEIIIPDDCLLSPREQPDPRNCPAVVGGNVETSQRVVDVLLGALQLAAASQGTMNNLLFGDNTFGYYETICGGSGATSSASGADAVHTHMTNTRLTDPEVLELRYPVRLREFRIRRGSGGAGLHRGGDGVIRRLEFLRELRVSLLTQRRGPYAPYGLSGGTPGALGENTLLRADGTTASLPNAAQFTASPGDLLTIHTPGGGGFGS